MTGQTSPHELLPLPQSDYMHARYYSSGLGRFLSVDPVGGTVGSSQSWNRYAYVRNNPLGYLDPTGEAWKISFDFSDSNLTEEQQQQVISGVVDTLTDAGVEDIQTFGVGDDYDVDPNDVIATLSFTNDVVNGNEDTSGSTPTQGFSKVESSSIVRTRAESLAGDSLINYLVNTAAHELGHSSGALEQYNWDSRSHGRSGQPGTIMGKHDVDTLAGSRMRFSELDAKQLRNTNERSFRQPNRWHLFGLF